MVVTHKHTKTKPKTLIFNSETRINRLNENIHIVHIYTQAPTRDNFTSGSLHRTPEYRSGGLMWNLENLAFRFRQNFQKFSILVQMASGVRQKVQNLFRWAHQASNRLNLFRLWQQSSKNCQICSNARQGTFKRSQEDLQVEIKHSERSKLQPYNCRPNKDQNLFVTSGCNEMYNITFSSQIATLAL